MKPVWVHHNGEKVLLDFANDLMSAKKKLENLIKIWWKWDEILWQETPTEIHVHNKKHLDKMRELLYGQRGEA